jgi:hypothetical protein
MLFCVIFTVDMRKGNSNLHYLMKRIPNLLRRLISSLELLSQQSQGARGGALGVSSANETELLKLGRCSEAASLNNKN